MTGKTISGVLVCILLLALAACVPAPTGSGNLPSAPTASPARVVSKATPGQALLLQNSLKQGQASLHVIDVATTADMPSYEPLPLGQNSAYAIPYAMPYTWQAAAHHLATVESHGETCRPYAGGESCYPSGNVLHLVDLQAWQEVTATLPTEGGIGPMQFSPGGARLAMVQTDRDGSALLLYDTRAAKLLAQRMLPVQPEVLTYNRAGTQLAVYGVPPAAQPGVSKPGAPQIILLDAATLDVLWDQVLSGVLSGFWCTENCDASHEMRRSAAWTPAVLAAPDGSRLYIVHADDDILTTVDLEARSVQDMTIRQPQTWLQRLLALTAGVAEAKGGTDGATRSAALSPDGSRLFMVSQVMTATQDSGGIWQTNETFPGLQVIDMASGNLLATYPSEALRITITPDGKYLLLDVWDEMGHGTDVVEAGSLQRVAQRLAWDITVISQPGGPPLVLAAHEPSGRRTQLALLDPTSFGIVRTWTMEGDDMWVGR